MKNLIKIFALVLTIATFSRADAQQTATQQDKASKHVEMKDLINNKDYVFEMTRPNSQTTDSVKYHKYHVDVNKDTLIVYLPLLSDSIKFNTTSYGYNCTAAASGGWLIDIKPNANMNNVKELKLSTTSQGTATLTVFLPGKKPIVYQGYIKQEDY